MCILMLFNKKNQYMFEEMTVLTKIKKETLKEELDPLVELKIITKEPANKELKMSDHFLVNNDFHNKNYKLKIPVKMKAFVNHSREKIKETAILERRYIIEACVMRLMKAKKKLNHNDLIE